MLDVYLYNGRKVGGWLADIDCCRWIGSWQFGTIQYLTDIMLYTWVDNHGDSRVSATPRNPGNLLEFETVRLDLSTPC